MTAPDRLDADPAPPAAARRLESAALACILAVLVARTFVGETPFRDSQAVWLDEPGEVIHKPPGELARATCAMVLLGGCALWALAQALRRRAALRMPAVGALIVVFAAGSFLSAWRAQDARGALDGAFEQAAILMAGFVAAHLAADRARWGLLLAVLAALAATLGVKGIYEILVEYPDRVAMFREDPAAQLAMAGVAPGTPHARMFAKRLLDRGVLGYFGLANVFASLLVVLIPAAAGVAFDKVAAAVRARRAGWKRRAGEVHLPTLAGGVAAVAVIPPVAALLLTDSIAGIAAGVFAVGAGAWALVRGGFLARHRGGLAAGAGAVAVGATAAVIVAGLWAPRLLPASLRVRWEYWAGSAGAVAEAPVAGVGAGNFGDAYLRHRLPGAAESTKTAHNVFFDAAAQFGLVGAAAYLAVLGAVLLGAARPAAPVPRPPPSGQRRAGAVAGWCVLLGGAVLAARWAWVGTDKPAALLVEAVMPAAVFAVFLLLAGWVGSAPGWAGQAGPAGRIGLVAGLVGFAAHNLLTYTLWMPATATVFWVAAMASAGGAAAPARRVGRKTSAALAGALWIGLIAAGIWLWAPVARRTTHLRAANAAYAAGRFDAAGAHLAAAVDADPLDGFAPGDLARFHMGAAGKTSPEAIRMARLAWRRSPVAVNADLLARALGPASAEGLAMSAVAVGLDPMNVRLRWRHAEALLRRGHADEAMGELRAVRRIDAARPADSDLRLTGEELAEIEKLQAACRRAAAATPPATVPAETAPAPP